MPKFLENKLKKQYGADSDIPYKIMNAKGFMHGNKETAKGAEAEVKHESKLKGLGNTKPKPVKTQKKKVVRGLMAGFIK